MIYDGSYNNYKHHRFCTFMQYESINEYSDEYYTIEEYSHPEDRRDLINKAKIRLKVYKSRNNFNKEAGDE